MSQLSRVGMKKLAIRWDAIQRTLLWLGLTVSLDANALSSPLIGWAEAIQIKSSPSILLQAKVDSGADHSSLHAVNMVYFTRENQTWIRFQSYAGTVIETPLIRMAKIKMKQGATQRRPVISQEICIGPQVRRITLNLVDRTHFNYPMLLGRSALQGFLINPSQQGLLGTPTCHD